MISKERRFYRASMRGISAVSVAITAVITVFLVVYITYNGIRSMSWKLVSTSPSYLRGTIGLLPDILNTLYIVFLTLLFVLPLGIGAAVYLTEYAKNKRLVSIIEFASETLSGIPSVIFGLVGMLVFTGTLHIKTSLLCGALTLAVMNLPTVMRTMEEALKTVPMSYREGAFALGAGKWKVIRSIVIPSSVSGIITGSILSVGRIIGESAALLYTAGFAHALNSFFRGITSSGATLTVALYVYAKEQGEIEVAFAAAFILLFLTIALNLLTEAVGRHFKGKGGEK